MTIIYGIKNCDSVKKATKWLTEHNISYVFHDYRSDGIDNKLIQSFLAKADWQSLLNKRSTTYRQLDDAVKESLNEQSFLDIIIAHPTLIKRPILVCKNLLEVGFKADRYQEIFQHES
ncbi:ArsC family reductase [Thalassotalea ganghwensis]